jgi:hypothetical protein
MIEPARPTKIIIGPVLAVAILVFRFGGITLLARMARISSRGIDLLNARFAEQFTKGRWRDFRIGPAVIAGCKR